MKSGLRIGELARRTGMSIDTIRFYERKRLIEAQYRSPSGYRYFAPAAIEELLVIRRAKDLGFSLSEIREILSLQAGGPAGSVQVTALIEKKIQSIQRKIEELQSTSAALRRLIGEAGHGPRNGVDLLRGAVIE